jgi:hypothetical protein
VRAAPSARKTTSLTHMLPSRRRFTFVTAAGNNVGKEAGDEGDCYRMPPPEVAQFAERPQSPGIR